MLSEQPNRVEVRKRIIQPSAEFVGFGTGLVPYHLTLDTEGLGRLMICNWLSDERISAHFLIVGQAPDDLGQIIREGDSNPVVRLYIDPKGDQLARLHEKFPYEQYPYKHQFYGVNNLGNQLREYTHSYLNTVLERVTTPQPAWRNLFTVTS